MEVVAKRLFIRGDPYGQPHCLRAADLGALLAGNGGQILLGIAAELPREVRIGLGLCRPIRVQQPVAPVFEDTDAACAGQRPRGVVECGERLRAGEQRPAANGKGIGDHRFAE